MRTLFVYGALADGYVHYLRIKDFVEQSFSATLKGSIFRLESGFPAYSKQGEQNIPGAVLKLKASDSFFPLLDELHGYSPLNPAKSLFLREELPALTIDGLSEQTFVYALNPDRIPKGATLIPDGDWVRNLKEQPTLVDRLTERQRTYVKRLGSSSGREIVPIQLDLYRELMGKGLIVDKGRRLALSNLGHEVYRFLE